MQTREDAAAAKRMGSDVHGARRVAIQALRVMAERASVPERAKLHSPHNLSTSSSLGLQSTAASPPPKHAVFCAPCFNRECSTRPAPQNDRR
eukprot:2516060-Pleurochrysis_carterae.AAC.1